MAAKIVFVCCVALLLVQAISGQCIGAVNNIAGTALAAEEIAAAGNAIAYGSNLAGNYGAGALGYPGAPILSNYGLAANSFVPSNGGSFSVTSASPIAPIGITVISENAIEGALAVNGDLPFLGAVALEGALPSGGAGGINYGCGNGAVGIVSENLAPAAAFSPAGPAYGAIAPAGIAPAGRFGYGPGLAGPGLGLAASGLGFNGLASPSCGFNGI